MGAHGEKQTRPRLFLFCLRHDAPLVLQTIMRDERREQRIITRSVEHEEAEEVAKSVCEQRPLTGVSKHCVCVCVCSGRDL